MEFTTPFQTERILLVPMGFNYEEELFQLHSDMDVMEFIAEPYSAIKNRDKIAKNVEHWNKFGFGLWCFLCKDSKDFIGRGGIRFQTLDNGRKILELSYILNKNFWSKGYATEMASYAINFAFETLNIDVVTALTIKANTKSQSVMKKIGMKFSEETVFYRAEENLLAYIEMG